jgi:bifunctional DNase/RNase
MLSTPLALAVSAFTLAAALATAAPPPPAATVQLEVAGVLAMPEGASSILVLREKGARTLLPLIVPGADAEELGGRLNARRAPELLGQVIRALGAQVREVEIARAEEVAGSARVRLAQGGRQLELSGRAAESVALAVAAGAPIVATRRLLDEQGLTPEDLARAKARLEGASAAKAQRL